MVTDRVPRPNTVITAFHLDNRQHQFGRMPDTGIEEDLEAYRYAMQCYSKKVKKAELNMTQLLKKLKLAEEQKTYYQWRLARYEHDGYEEFQFPSELRTQSEVRFINPRSTEANQYFRKETEKYGKNGAQMEEAAFQRNSKRRYHDGDKDGQSVLYQTPTKKTRYSASFKNGSYTC